MKMKLERASQNPPRGLQELLADLGDGENGFTGTPVHNGGMAMRDYLQSCCDMSDESKLKSGLVPQTVFWVLDPEGIAIGMVKVRHYLNANLRIHGGHIGYFISSDQRGKGYGKQALALALVELRKLGETRVLITINPENIPSLRVVEANGGQYHDMSSDPETGLKVKRYWIRMKP
ncbi:MAG: GNAT family N-acetyltransferase [Anaerolineales bacterium]